MFTLADGTQVSDMETLDEGAYAFVPEEPITRVLPDTVPLARRIKTGDRFIYVFDLGDSWTHLCTVEGTVDPYDVLGVHVIDPTPFWGWGSVPDQYGRRWADDSGDPHEHPPARDDLDLTEMHEVSRLNADRLTGRELRIAAAAGPKPLIEAITAKDLSEVLQQTGAALLDLNAAGSRVRSTLEGPLFAILQRLEARSWPGDDLLAEAVLAVLQRREPASGKPTPIDVAEIADMMHGELAEEGVDVALTTGEVVSAGLTSTFWTMTTRTPTRPTPHCGSSPTGVTGATLMRSRWRLRTSPSVTSSGRRSRGAAPSRDFAGPSKSTTTCGIAG